MFEPRVIYACNHYVVENFNEAASLAVSSGETIDDELYRRKDILFPNSSFDKDGIITVNSIECIEALGEEDGSLQFSVNCKTYLRGEHFEIGYEMKASEEKEFQQYVYIKWLKGNFELPNLYSAEVGYTRTISQLYKEDECPRCNADGWYVGVFESGNVNPSKVKSKNKLVQTFLKYIYTRKTETGYGSRMLDIPGKYDLTDTEFVNTLIRDEIMSFKDYYTDKVSAMMLKGYSFDDGEIMKGMSVSDIEIDTETLKVKVTVTFLTADGKKSGVDLMVATL